MIFLTVGSRLPFDRLVRAIDELVQQGVISEPIRAQIGDSLYRPKHLPYDRMLDRADFERCVSEADALISHAGIGTIATALAHSKPLLVLPRLKRFSEVVSDHQVKTARKYAELGHLIAADEASDLARLLPGLHDFKPLAREASAQRLAQRIGRFLAQR